MCSLLSPHSCSKGFILFFLINKQQDQMKINIFYHLCFINFNVGLLMKVLFELSLQMRSRYFDPIEHSPNKIDQLLDALHRVGFISY